MEKISFPTDAESELKILSDRIDQLSIKLGRADFEVARVESLRNVIRVELNNEMQQLQAFVVRTAKKAEVPDSWRFDVDARAFIP